MEDDGGGGVEGVEEGPERHGLRDGDEIVTLNTRAQKRHDVAVVEDPGVG